ncbi:hypothetical protein [Salinilacihabitans rarus]|uniref:hypothetical protein n=1 Tax=Salinilacihabitans rarus TaxID=2961596 RepID=UPI0020C93667|nr:hypothetical protein [Salinilacihabitans rarus]
MTWTRRTLLGAVVATAPLAGCLGDDDGADDEGENEDDGTYDTHLDEMDDYDLVDRTGADEVEIRLAPDGEPRFEPDAIKVESMTPITWVWGEDGYDLYPVDVPDPCKWSGSERQERGSVHQWRFPFEGKHEYGSTSPDGEEFTGVFFVVD